MPTIFKQLIQNTKKQQQLSPESEKGHRKFTGGTVFKKENFIFIRMNIFVEWIINFRGGDWQLVHKGQKGAIPN